MRTQEAVKLLTLDNLRDWGNSKAAGESVGETDSAECCPLSKYLEENAGDSWSVANGVVSWRGHMHTRMETDPVPLPDLAQLLEQLIDDLGVEKVSREMFLAVLERLALEMDEAGEGANFG